MQENRQLQSIDLDDVSFQNFADDTNIDAYDGNEVWTRSPKLGWQVWRVKAVGVTYEFSHEGEKVYTISMAEPTSPQLKGKNIEASGEHKTVRLAAPDENKLSQRWVLRFQDDRTVIQNMKYQQYVLTGIGKDQPIKLLPYDVDSNDAQRWTPYNKARTFLASEDSRYITRAGV